MNPAPFAALRAIASIIAFAVTVGPADARSARAKYQFQKANPCPVTGAHRGRCPGHQIDHIKPLCAGGADHPGNMQWLTVADHRMKTRRDVFECRAARKPTIKQE